MPNLQFVIDVDSTGAVVGVRTFQQALASVGTTATTSSEHATTAFSRMEKIINRMQSAVYGFIGAFVFREIVQGIGEIINAGIEFESSFAGVRKTVDGSVEQFDQLNDQFRQLAKIIPVSVNEINRIGQVGGQVGVTVDKLKEFTETISMVGMSSEIPTEEAATNFARLSQIMGENISNVRTLASVIVDLDAKNAASAREILAFSMNIAGAGKQVGMTSTEVAALAVTLASTGLGAEKAGSAISRTLMEMNRAVDEGGNKLQILNAIIGGDFKKAFEESAIGALRQFATGLQGAMESGQNIIPILESLGLRNIRVEDTLARLSLSSSTFSDAIRDAGEEAGKAGESLTKRFAIAAGTTEAQLTILYGRLNDLFISLSQQILPTILSVAKAFVEFAEFLKRNWETVKTYIEVLSLFAGALIAIKIEAYAASLALKAFAGSSLVGFIGQLSTGLITLKEFAAGLAALEVGAMAAVASYLGLILVLYKWWTALMDTIEAIKGNDKAMDDLRKRQQENIEMLKKHGIHVADFLDGTIDMGQAIAKAMEVLKADIDVQKAAAAAKEKEAKIIAYLTEEQIKYNAKVDEGVAKVTQKSKADKLMVDILEKLFTTGVSTNAILDEYGKEIEEIHERMAMLGEEQFYWIESLHQSQEELNRVREAAERLDPVLTAQINKIVKDREEQTKYNAMLERTPALLEAIRLARLKVDQAALNSMGLNPYDTGPMVVPGEENPMLSEEEMHKRREKAAADERKYIDDIMRYQDRALDKLFKRLVEKGTLAWKDVADFAVTAFNPVMDSLFAPLRTKLMTPLADWMKDISNGISKHVSDLGNKVSGLFGGSKGGALAGLVSGVASAGIGAAVSMGMQLIAGLLKKSGSEVNDNLVKIQNPFSEAVSNLMDSFNKLSGAGKQTLDTAITARTSLMSMLTVFKADTAAYAALGEKQALAVRNMFATIEQYWGTDLIELFNRIDGEIVALGGSAGMTAKDLESLNESIKELAEFQDAVRSITETVTGTNGQFNALEQALRNLFESGVPTTRIIEELGGQIEEAFTTLVSQGRAVPQFIQFIHDMMQATKDITSEFERMTESMTDLKGSLKSVQSELESVTNQLSSTLISAFDKFTNEIAASEGKLDKWMDSIFKLDEEIADSEKTLHDAAHWQKKYADAIDEANNAVIAAHEKRMDIEKQIADLQIEIEKDRLERIIKTSKNETILALAKINLDRLNQKSEEDKIKQLADLQEQLKDQIELEQQAKEAFDLKKAAAELSIAAEMMELQVKIDSKKAEREEIVRLIDAELLHVDSLKKYLNAVKFAMEQYGVIRESENDQIITSIISLIQRKQALEGEEAALQATIDRTKEYIDYLDQVGKSIGAPAVSPGTAQVLPGPTQMYIENVNTDTGPISTYQPMPDNAIWDQLSPEWMMGARPVLMDQVVNGETYDVLAGAPNVMPEVEVYSNLSNALTGGAGTSSSQGGDISVELNFDGLTVITQGQGADAGKEAAYELVRTFETDGELQSRLTRLVSRVKN